MRHFFRGAFRLLLGLVGVSHVLADQPIFNEMPRWAHGWGVQFVEEYRHESDLMSGGDVVADGFSEDVHTLHIEGVYTWDKSIRMTAKIPYVIDAERELPDGSGGKVTQHDNGIGDLTLALPLKKYFNLDGRSGSWTLTPQIRVPLSGDDEYGSTTELGAQQYLPVMRQRLITTYFQLEPPLGYLRAIHRSKPMVVLI